MHSFYGKSFRRLFQQAVVSFISVSMIVPMPLLMAQSPAIVPDGRTQTTVTTNTAGTVTDVRTQTIRGTSGYNSFDRFNVQNGNTTNLYVPDGAKSLVNLVHGERSQIDGILNSYKNGQIGGNVFFMNPNGIVVGTSGEINVGSLHLQTPTADYMKQLINERGEISAVHEQMLFSGNVPISPSGLISVRGKINAVEEIQLSASNIDLAHSSSLRAGRQVQVEFGDVVNTEKLNWGNDLVVTPEGKIRIVASNDVSVAGEVRTDAMPGEVAGNIEIKSGNDVSVNAGAHISSQGVGANSDGGKVVIFADHNANLEAGASVDVRASGGKGGFLEFSAKDTVNIEGNGLRSSAGGTILIDPNDIVWEGAGYDVFTNGADYKLIANSISLNNVFISTRQVAGTDRNAHLTGVSTGNSGNIFFDVEPMDVGDKGTIDLTDSSILSFATGGYDAGAIAFFAYNLEGQQVNAYPRMTWTNTVIDAHAENGKAGDIVVSAISRQMTLDRVTFRNDSNSGKHGNLLIGDYRKGFLGSNFLDYLLDITGISKYDYSMSPELLDGGGTFTFNNGKITTGGFYVKSEYPNGSELTSPITPTITFSGTNVLADRIRIESEEDVFIRNSTLETRKSQSDDIFISVMRNDWANKFDVVAKKSRSIVVDADSTIEGSDIVLQVVVTAGLHLEARDDGTVVNKNGEKVSDEDLSAFRSFADTTLGIFTDTIPDLLSGYETPILAAFRGYDVTSAITIDGKLTAENSIDILSTAAVEANASALGVAGFAFNVVVTKANSTVTVGPTAEIVAKNGGIKIESVVTNSVSQSTSNAIPVNAIPIDISLGLAVMTGENKISIQNGAKLTAEKGTIDLSAYTERCASISATGGRNNSNLAFSVGILVEDFNTNVTIGGSLTANAVDVSAVTNSLANVISAKTLLGESWLGGGIATATDMASPVINAVKTKIFAAIKSAFGKDLGGPSEAVQNRNFGMGLGLAVMVDDIDTTITVAGSAVVNAQERLSLDAYTKNIPVAVASTIIGKYKLNEGDKQQSGKDQAITMSLPVVVVLQDTKAIIETGANIHVGAGTKTSDGISVHAETAMPYNTSQFLANLIASFAGVEDSAKSAGVAGMLLSDNLGIDAGLFNTWSQTSADAETTAIGTMLSVVYLNNNTVAKICDGVTIDNKVTFDGTTFLPGLGKPNLSVTAITDTQLGHVTGNMRSFLNKMPDTTNVSATNVSGLKKLKDKDTYTNVFQSMWGNQGDKGVGVGVSFNWIDNTAIAEIGAAILDVNNLNVSAETKGFDISISVGASKTDEFGLNGSLGVSVIQTDARAIVGEEAKITASGDVKIDAKDRTIIVGVGGNLSVSEGNAFGLSVIVPIVIRDIRAVWGNYLDEGSSAIAPTLVESVVGGNVKVHAEALGVTAALAVAGAVTTEEKPDPGKKLKSPEETIKNATNWFNEMKGNLSPGSETAFVQLLKSYQESLTGGNGSSGGSSSSDIGIAGAVAVNLLIEEVCAGISGNVKITVKSFDIAAENKDIDAAFVGGLVVQLDSGDNKGIAGAVGANLLFGDTKAFVDTSGGTLTYTDNFSIHANREGYIGALTASAAGSSSSSGFEIAGSVSVASIASETLTNITNTTITSVNGDMTVGADNKAMIVNIAGGIAVGGKASVGLSLAASNLTLDTRVALDKATIDARNLATTAKTESLIVTIALGGGVSYSGEVGVGGTVAVVISDGDTSVSIKDSTLTLAGNLLAIAWSDTYNGTDGTYGNLLHYLTENEGEDSNYLDDEGETVKFDKSEATYDSNGKAVRADTTEEKEIKLGLSSRSPRIVTAALAVGVGKEVGVGANIGVNLMTEETFVSISGSTIRTQGTQGIGIEAKTEGGVISVAVGVGASKSVGVAGNLGVNLVGGRTEVVLNASTLTANKGNVGMLAQSTAGIVNASLSVGAGGDAGIGVGFAYNMVAHSVAVDLVNSTVVASSGSVNMAALNDSDLIGILLSIGAGNTAGVGVALSINTIGTIQLDDADLESPEDTQTEKKKRDNDLKLIANTVSNVEDDNNPLVVIGNARNRTEVTIVESVVESGNDIKMNAASKGGMISISAAVGAAGTAGVGVGAAYNSISGSVRIFGHNSNVTAQRNVIGSSQINNAMYSVVVGGGVGGTAGVAVSADANVLMASNEINFSSGKADKGKIRAVTGDIVFKASNSGEVLGSSLTLAGGQYAGVAAALTVNVLKGQTNVRLTNTTLTAGDSIVLDAETTNDLYSITGALALTISGTGSAAVGATVAVNDLKSAANISIVDSALTAEGNALIHTLVDADLLAVTGNAAVAVALFGVSVAGSVTYNGLRSTSDISISGTSIDAKANKGSTFNGLASYYGIGGISGTFNNKKGIGIGAYTHSEIENYFFLLAAASLAGVNVGVPVNDMNATTTISLDNSNLNQATGGTAAASVQDIVIEALTETESTGVVAGLAGGIAAVSAIVDMHLLHSHVETNIKNSNLKAARNISIGSKNSDNTLTVFVGVAIGGVAVPINAQGIISTASVKTNIENTAGKTNRIEAGNNLDIYAESLLDIFEINLAAAVGGSVGAGIAFTINNLEQVTSINFKGAGTYNLISGNALSVKAQGKTVFTEHIDALGVSEYAGVGGAMGLTFVDSFTEIAFDAADVNLQGNTINVQADDIFTQKLSQVGGFAVGMVGAAAGINVLELRNGASIRGSADMKGNSIIVNAAATRNIEELYTIAGAAGAVGLSGTICHITIGGAKGSNEGINDTLSQFSRANLGGSSTTRTNGIAGSIQNVPGKLDASAIARQSSALVLGGTLEASVIDLRASANNNINTTAAGLGVGLCAGAGGALLFVNVSDNITASFTGTAKANGFSLQGKSQNTGHTSAIAGGAGYYAGLAGAGNWTTITNNITASLGADSIVEAANAVAVKTDQTFSNFTAEADAGALGAVGVGGAVVSLTLKGDSIVNVAQNAKIYAPMITLEALKKYNGVKSDAYGLAGGLASGAGVGILLNLGGNSKVIIAHNAKLRTSATGNPSEYDEIYIGAGVNVANAVSRGGVDAGGLAVAAFGDTDVAMNFDTIIDIGRAELLSGIITLDAYREIRASALHTTDTGGFGVAAGGLSTLKLAGNNKINLSQTSIEAWHDLLMSAGSGTNILDAQTRVFNGGVIPVTGGKMVNATTDVAVANRIDMANSTLRAVRDIIIQTGQEDYTNVAYATTQYLYTGSGGSFIRDTDFSLNESSGTVKTNNSNTIALAAGNNLEAGIHWNTSITINNNGTGVSISKPDWVSVTVTTGEKSMYDLFSKQINALQEKLALQTGFSAMETAAYQAEIDYLKAQLAYYALNPSGNLTDAANYAKAKLVQIVDNITAAAGDIQFFTGTDAAASANSITAVSGNVLTANDSPQIVIVNNSNHFLEILGADLTVPNPMDGGGRILVNGNADATIGSATLHSNKDGSAPLLSIQNTKGSASGVLAPELFLTSASLNNPGGLVALKSEGSIWLATTSLNARDISISTAGSFYQGYQDGRVDVGGNPLASGSSVAQAINQWMNSSMFFANDSALLNLLASYNDAMNQLQDAATSASWAAVFGTGGSGNVNNLAAKPGRTLTTLISAYNAAKTNYLNRLSTLATNFVKSKVTTYKNARADNAGLPSENPDHGYSNQARPLVSSSSSGPNTISVILPTLSGDQIYGQRSVFISAEMLNVNGTIHSGSLEFNIDLTSAAVLSAIALAGGGVKDITQAVFGTKYDENKQSVAFPKITYNNGTVTMDNIEAMGGNITLFGNIISTGNGKLLVEDGYGNITITAPTNMDIVLGRVDTGLGSQGVITIYDTSKGTATAPLKTVYTRENGQMKVNGVNSSNYSYATTANRWLQTTLSMDTTLTWTYTYDHDFGITFGSVHADWMAADSDKVTGVSGSVSLGKTSPVGTFLVSNAGLNSNNNLYGTYSRTAYSPTEYYTFSGHQYEWTDGIAHVTGHCHHEFDFTANQRFVENFTSYLNASKPIAIQFTGNETVGSVIITGGRNITLRDLVRAADILVINTGTNIVGATNPTANPLITAKNVSLSSTNIGAANHALKLESVYGGTTLGVTATGNINLAVSNNPLRVGTVTGNNITITSDSDVFNISGDGITAQNNLAISVKSGKISGENAANFTMKAGGNVKLSATGDIRIEHQGNLFVDQIATGQDGDLYITVSGSIIDRNIVAEPDPYSDAEMGALWAELGLIGGSAAYNEKIDRKVKAYENEFTELYFEAWRKADYNAENYNPNFVYRYNSVQRAVLLASDWTDAQIAAEENKRTQAYHQAFKADYDEHYRYTASTEERNALMEYTAWTEKQLKNAFNIPMFMLTQDAGSRNNTTSLIEEPNFAGRNITLSATGSIGTQDSGKVVIPLGISSDEFAQNDGWRRAVADAEWDDVEFGTDKITITRYDDIDVAASGWLKTFSRDGATYLGAQSDVTVNEIVSGSNGTTKGTQPLRFKMDGSMLPLNVDKTSIYARNAILEAAGGTIGTAATPLIINLTGGNAGSGWISARGTEGTHIDFVNAAGEAATAFIREFGSMTGDITIIAGTIVDALPEVQAAKVAGRNITLVSSQGDMNLWIEQIIDGSLIVSVAGHATLTSRRSTLNFALLDVSGNADIWTKGGGMVFTDADVNVAGDAVFKSVRSIAFDHAAAVFNNAEFTAVDDISFVNSVIVTTGDMNLFAGDEIFVLSSSVTVGGNMSNESSNDFTAVDADMTVLKNMFISTRSDISIVASTITVFDDLEAVALNDISIVGSAVYALENLSLTSLNKISLVVADAAAVGGNTSKTAGNGVFDIRMPKIMGTAPLPALMPYTSVQWTEHIIKTASGANMIDGDDEDDDILIDGYWLPNDGQETLAVPVALMD